MVDEVSPQRQKPVVPQPMTTNATKTTPPNSSATLEEDNMLLDFGMATSASATQPPSVVVAPKKPDMMLKDDPIFSDLISPSPPHVASSSSSNIDTLLGKVPVIYCLMKKFKSQNFYQIFFVVIFNKS